MHVQFARIQTLPVIARQDHLLDIHGPSLDCTVWWQITEQSSIDRSLNFVRDTIRILVWLGHFQMPSFIRGVILLIPNCRVPNGTLAVLVETRLGR